MELKKEEITVLQTLQLIIHVINHYPCDHGSRQTYVGYQKQTAAAPADWSRNVDERFLPAECVVVREKCGLRD